MKKFLTRFLIFIFISTLFYIIGIFIWNEIRPANLESNLNYRPAHGGHLYSRLRDAEQVNGNVDILVVGSSHAYRSFDPRIFSKNGFEIFNLGSSAQTPIQSEVLLHKYLNKFNPKLVVMEIYPGSLTSDGIESALDLISNVPQIDKFTQNMVFNLNNLKLWNTFILVKINSIIKFYNNLSEPKCRINDCYINGGFVQNFSKNSSKCISGLTFGNLNSDQIKAIERIEKMLQEMNVKLVFISAPVSKQYFNSYSNYQEYFNIFKDKNNFYNYSQLEMLNDKEHFIDCDHLNQKGVETFNDLILKSNIFSK